MAGTQVYDLLILLCLISHSRLQGSYFVLDLRSGFLVSRAVLGCPCCYLFIRVLDVVAKICARPSHRLTGFAPYEGLDVLDELVHIGHIKLDVLLLVNELLLELQEDRFARLGAAGRVHQGRSKSDE